MKRFVLSLFLVCILLGSIQFTTGPNQSALDNTGIQSKMDDIGIISADPGVTVPSNPYIVLELIGGDITNHGSDWSALLDSMGISNVVLQTSDVLADPSILHGAPAILVDGSLGSSSGNLISQNLVNLLIREDITLILTGRSAWLLHRLSGRSPPSMTAPVATTLAIEPEYAGAVFLSQPVSLTIGAILSTEVGLVLPIDIAYTEMSCIVNLTGSSTLTTSPLRFDSWPLDIFLFAFENPALLTSTGQGLFENTVAFCNAIRETVTATELAKHQTSEGDLLAGGFSYLHSPLLISAYYTAHSAEALLEGTSWTNWVTANTPLVRDILNSLMVDFGSETGFMTSLVDGLVSVQSTAHGLWLLTTLGLSAEFPVSEIVQYLSSRQEVEGGFDNYITTTFFVTEALAVSGHLGEISTYDLEIWLRSLVIDGSKTSDPDLWGSIGSNPSSISPCTNYALEYLRSLTFIGKAHPDPAKLTSWILTRTSVGDGSFKNTNSLDEEIVTGTASALACMQILGTLSNANKTNGLQWLSSNQLASGGFGMKDATNDLVAKTRETSRVASCLESVGETSGSIASGVLTFIDSISTEVGFEAMDNLPSLMWTSWILEASRLAHVSPAADLDLALEYLNGFETLRVYPFWSNLTTTSAPEYGVNQYRTKSVWTQYFGVSVADTLGVELNSNLISDIVLYLSQSQYMTGHYRPTSFMGTAHMQHTVAAVETLYLIDELDTIPYRSALDTAILSEYSSGSWDSAGWTLEPFAGFQEAIDFLSTRAALRLGIVTSTMAAEITASIESRIQYTDLVALSMDVATLSLLRSAFSVNLDSVDSNLVLSALRSSHFTDGWFNDTILWQPVFTDSVLKMVSILGLRCQLYDTLGVSFVSTTNATTELGSTLDISMNITSADLGHSVLVDAFGERTLFTNVANSDTLSLLVPSSLGSLGSWDIFIMVSDWGSSRAFGRLTVDVTGTLQGSLDLETPLIKMGESINGTASWTLTGGSSAGISHVVVRLGDPPSYQQYSYDEVSPFWFSIPSTDFEARIHNITVTIEVPNCSTLVLKDEVTIAEPNPTYLTTESEVDGLVGSELDISWSLHYQENDSLIANQDVTLEIKDGLDAIIYSELLTSESSIGSFSWIPSTRGDFTYILTFDGNGTLDDCHVQGIIHVYESTVITWIGTGTINQYSTVTFTLRLTTPSAEFLNGQSLHIAITSPSMVTIVDTILTTNSTGHSTVTISLSENGNYLLQADFSGVGFLLSSSDSDLVISWSSSQVDLGGVIAEETIGGVRTLWAQLKDLISNPVQGQSITLRVILLPSTILMEQTLTSNSSGHVSMQWSATASGSFRFEADYAGITSRGSTSGSFDFNVLIPVTLTISYSSSPEVGVLGWIHVVATDHLSNPISGLTVTVSVERSGGGVDYTDITTTSGGLATFSWTPSSRGINDITATSVKQSWFFAGFTNIGVGVFEIPVVSITMPIGLIAPTTDSIEVNLHDGDSNPIVGATVHTIVTLNGSILYDTDDITNAAGLVTITLAFNTPGQLIVQVQVSAQGWLLEKIDAETSTVTADTTLTITIPGQPVEQGSTVGVTITILDFSSSPLVGASINITVTWSNGSLLNKYSRTSDGSGQCTLAQPFNFVGDFIIGASFAGYGYNSSASDSVPQRVYTTPIIQLFHDPSSIVGNPMEFQVAYLDSLGDFIVGRIIHLSIEQEGVEVFSAQVPSINGLVTITWYPSQGGLADITVLHVGNILFLTNSTTSTSSVLELVDGELWITPDHVDVFGSTTLVYNLTTALPQAGVTIHFEVLAMDLVPLWSADVLTNASGIASIIYVADDGYGILVVDAGPVAEEFLIGGDIQEQLIVMTYCDVTVSLNPSPPAVNTITNISFNVNDDLGGAVDGISITVTVYDPYNDPIKLGLWANSITVSVVHGLAIVEFTPAMVGLYTVSFSSSGSISTHGFTDSTIHTIYATTDIILSLSSSEIEVGETLNIFAQLLDHVGNPMIGRSITLFLDGPGASSFGPVELTTDASGFVAWSVEITEEGLWTLDVSFEGLGVYLPSSSSEEINVKYGTVIQLDLLNPDAVIAGMNDTSFSILLEDSGGTPLEGFTVHYEARHHIFGLIIAGDLIQSGASPMILNIALNRMGNVTFIVSFGSTSHYYASNAALQLWVRGTTEVIASIPSSIDRSSEDGFTIAIEDEISDPILLSEINITFEITGPQGLVDLTSRLLWNDSSVDLFINAVPVGQYSLAIVVESSIERLGCVANINFTITSITVLSADDDGLTGFISTVHSLVFFLNDSLKDAIDGADVWVSIYDPLEREIYGHPLSTRTLLSSSAEGREVSWTPLLTGEYRVVIIFEGNDLYYPSNTEIMVLVRYPSSLNLNAPLSSEFGDIIPITMTLEGAIGGLGSENVTITVLHDGIVQIQESLVTGSRGVANHNLVGLLAGSHTIRISFNGSDSQAPCSGELIIEVTPVLVLALTDEGSLFIGRENTISISVSVLGTSIGWTGSLDAVLFNPSGEELDSRNFEIDSYSILDIDFLPVIEGTYSLNVTIHGLPVIVTRTYPLAIAVVRESLQIQLDTGNTSLLGGFGFLTVLGVIMRKKMRGLAGSMPGEWTG